MFPGKNGGGQVAHCRMPPLPVIGYLDVFHDSGFYFFSCALTLMIHQLAFQTPPETLHRGVVIAVATAAHGYANPMPLKILPVIGGAILAPPVCMVNHARPGPGRANKA